MKVVVKDPGQKPVVQDIENKLEVLQELVDGYIQVVYLDESTAMICNEEGKRKELFPNFVMGNDVIVGTAIFVGTDDENEDFTDIDWFMEQILVNNFKNLFPVF